MQTFDKISSSLISRIKQQLSHEFPEVSNVRVDQIEGNRRSLIVWLAQRDLERNKTRKSPYYKKHLRSVATKYGIKISEFTRFLATQIDDNDVKQAEIKDKLQELIYSSEFTKYNQIFDEFRFNLGLRALLINLIYPFESRFSDIGGFKKRIGSAQREESSGSTASWRTGDGSKLCRAEFYLWVSTIITKKESSIDSFVITKLKNFYQERKAKFSTNPEDYIQRREKGILDKMLTLMEELVRKSNDKDHLIKFYELKQLALQEQAEKPIIPSQKNEKFGILIINQAIGYASRLLYRRFRDTLK